MPDTANIIARRQRKERTGEVVSSKMQKTIVVSVKRRFPHPQFKKVVTSFKKFYAHDEKSEAKVGDIVRIEETRPTIAVRLLGCITPGDPRIAHAAPLKAAIWYVNDREGVGGGCRKGLLSSELEQCGAARKGLKCAECADVPLHYRCETRLTRENGTVQCAVANSSPFQSVTVRSSKV